MAEVEGDKGLSKKELNKLARKAGKAGTGAPTAVAVPSDATVFAVVFCKGAKCVPVPDITRTVDLLLVVAEQKTVVKYTINKTANHIPCMYLVSSPDENTHVGSISGDCNIAKFLIKSFPEVRLSHCL